MLTQIDGAIQGVINMKLLKTMRKFVVVGLTKQAEIMQKIGFYRF